MLGVWRIKASHDRCARLNCKASQPPNPACGAPFLTADWLQPLHGQSVDTTMRNATDIFRGLICLTAGAASSFGVGISFSGPASAQTFPSKPVRIVVGFAPGGPSDIISRLVGTKMSEILGHQFVIENKAGAGGVIAIETVGRSDPDGYTILNTPLGNAVNETLSANLKFKVGDGLVAIAPLAETANVLVVQIGRAH